ncbi:MAG: CPBP family intramembrane glutamic endopeptidase [Paraclostridium sp.]|uniref:CPBP family intramembrane glutamic endopeptidase n=1 Tax=Paraclostridium sp. TaxID=2023273 RepID=UPI003F2CB0EF
MSVSKESLFQKAKNSKYLPNFIIAPILAFMLFIAGQLIGQFISMMLYLPMSKLGVFLNLSPNFMEVFLRLIFTTSITILLTFLWIKFIEKRKISSIGLESNNLIVKYITGFVIGLAMMTATVVVLYLFGAITVETSPKQLVGSLAIINVICILPAWMIQSASEEIVARGWLMNVLGARYTPAIGLIISSVFFGVSHLGNPGVSFIAILNIILVGLFLGMYVIKTNDLWGACGIHAAWNFSQGNIFGFEVSGGDVLIGSIVDLNLKGNELISGGIFGPEAGLGATIIISICIIVVGISFKNKKNWC